MAICAPIRYMTRLKLFWAFMMPQRPRTIQIKLFRTVSRRKYPVQTAKVSTERRVPMPLTIRATPVTVAMTVVWLVMTTMPRIASITPSTTAKKRCLVRNESSLSIRTSRPSTVQEKEH